MSIGTIKSKTLLKFLHLINLTIDNRRILSVDQIIVALDCCEDTAYQYQRALRLLFPRGQFRTRQNRQQETEGEQTLLT